MSGAWFFPAAVAALLTLAVAFFGMTITDLGPWYHALRQPGWAPPEELYAIAWTVIYALTALSGVTAWLHATEQRQREWLLGLFALNGFLNISWSYLFFRFRRPDWALVEIVALWLSVAALIAFTRRLSTRAAMLLVPYIIWVSFAGCLNLAVVKLNGPFS